MTARRHAKDLYHVVTPAPEAGVIVIGNRLVRIPANVWRVYSLAAGPEYGALVHEHAAEPAPPIFLNGDNDQPTTCPTCGARTDWTEGPTADTQTHTCLGCGYRFALELDKETSE